MICRSFSSFVMSGSVGIFLGTATLFGAGSSTNMQTSVLTNTEMQRVLGGACQSHGCKDQNCACLLPEVCTRINGTNNCNMQVGGGFARCASIPGATTNCSETSGTSCGTKHTGTVDAAGKCSCSATPQTCGPVRYTCTASSCES